MEDAVARAREMTQHCTRIGSVVQRDEHVREQARELALRHGNVQAINIVFPDSVLWAATLSDERVRWLVRWALIMLARATLAVGGQVRRELVPSLELHADDACARVETHSRASAQALPYLRTEVRKALARVSHTALLLTTSFELDGAPAELIVAPHVFFTGTGMHTLSPLAYTHACAACARVDSLLLCGGCERTYYCSRPCQRQHRAAHVPQCHRIEAPV